VVVSRTDLSGKVSIKEGKQQNQVGRVNGGNGQEGD
jgi:hypothetical protein